MSEEHLLCGVKMNYVLVFFFQAEDGIRYFHVTGVQTCALPILKPAAFSTSTPAVSVVVATRERRRRVRICSSKSRSEERRVGRVCGSSWLVVRPAEKRDLTSCTLSKMSLAMD